MTQVQKLIEVKAKSEMRFQEAVGQPITYEEAIKIATKKIQESLAEAQNETWIDITTGKQVQGQF